MSFETAMVALPKALELAGGLADMQVQEAQRKYEARVARQNLELLGAQSRERELQVRREGRETLAQQAAAVAESGLAPTGSNRLIMAQDAALAELDALNARYEGAMARWQEGAKLQALRAKPPSIGGLLGGAALSALASRKGLGGLGAKHIGPAGAALRHGGF